ncbi:MAG: 2,3-diphosphoglycerate-dependent phosphoglycerate mutase [Candidatus Woesearchaeota archaeon]
MIKLVLLRHGESLWNKENRFTGWTDVELSNVGIRQAKEAGRRLKAKGFTFDIAYASPLKRARHTLDLTLKEMEHNKIPIKKSWRLNERHYGALQGLNKAETAAKYGEKQVLIWRRSYSVRPPALDKNGRIYAKEKAAYKEIKNPPRAESLKDVVRRFLPYWKKEILPGLRSGKKILIAAHGNSLRALMKYLDEMSDEQIMKTNIPVGIPLVYEFDKRFKPVKHYYLASNTEMQAAINSVKQQGKAAR